MGPSHLPDDGAALRRCVRELTAMSMLSAVWTGCEPPTIATSLANVVSRAVPLAFAGVRLQEAGVEAASTAVGSLPPELTARVNAAIDGALAAGHAGAAVSIDNPLGSGTVRVVQFPLGCAGECGALVAGSADPDFPSATDRLLISIACNQAAIVLGQKRSELQIRRSEQELADFFDNATVGLHWVGPDGTILRANRAELTMLGYSTDEYVGRHIADFHVDRDVIDAILQCLHRGETVHGCEARMRCKDGSIRHVLIDSSVLREQERFIHTRCFTRDITEQKRTEESRARLAAIVESSDDAIIGRDLNGNIISWNRGAEAMFGYTAAEMIGRPAAMLIPPDDHDEFAAALRQLQRGDRVAHYEAVRVGKYGRRLDVSITISPIRDGAGKIQGVSKIARDITERRRAETASRQQAERLRLLWESASVLLTADDPDAMLRMLFTKIGPHLGADAYFNYMVNDRRDALRLVSCVGIPPDTARQMARLEFGQAISGTAALHRRPIVATEIQRSNDPEAQLIKSLGVRAYACNPLIAGDLLLGTLSFASRSKDRFEADELAFIETICHYVTVACERLRLLNELKDSDRRKDEFLATLAHELRNPLAPIRNAVRVLHIKGAQTAEARWGRDVIERQVDHLTRLIDDLLEVSRITRNQLELRKQRVDLNEVIAGAIEASRPLIEASRHDLTVSLPAEPVYLEGDLVRLAQVFLNLLNNAAKYTEPGGRIWLTAERHGTKVTVTVKDTGVGIPPDKLPHLFQMFYQVDRSLERSRGGLGIGLSLVRRLVLAHDGTVEARSDGPGKGSEFIVRLPVIAATAAAEPERDEAADNRSPAAARILVADDNRDSTDSLVMLLRLNGNDVHGAYDGMEAVEAAELLKPDLVLLDIGMPRLNGLEVCRRIRSTSWGRQMTLVALTGWAQEHDRRRTSEAGFDAHLVKPIDPNEVIKLLAARPGLAH